jgi:hypothetical protein
VEVGISLLQRSSVSYENAEGYGIRMYMFLLMLVGVLGETRMLTFMFIEVLLPPDGLVGGRWKRRSQDGLARIDPKTSIEQIVQHTKRTTIGARLHNITFNFMSVGTARFT